MTVWGSTPHLQELVILMSFSATFAGTTEDVSNAITQDDGYKQSPFNYGGELGKLTRDYLTQVAALNPVDKRLIVEASGHADSNTVSLNLRVITVHH